jgi:hypothetical protein
MHLNHTLYPVQQMCPKRSEVFFVVIIAVVGLICLHVKFRLLKSAFSLASSALLLFVKDSERPMCQDRYRTCLELQSMLKKSMGVMTFLHENCVYLENDYNYQSLFYYIGIRTIEKYEQEP